MKTGKTKFCPALWFSGFFGLGAIAHLVRAVTGFSLVVAGREIPVSFSAAIALVFGALSAALLILSVKRPCEGEKDKGSSCCK